MIASLLLAADLAIVPVEKIADDFANHAAAIVLASSADYASTGWGLYRCPTCYEGNPLGPNVEARLSLKIGADAAMLWTVWKLERHGHHNGAKWATWVYVAGKAVIVGFNVSHALRRR